MAERKIRMRFTPSPTGALHIGGIRTALYNYLFAHQHGGDLVFRIEDTNSHRFVPGAEEYTLESFKWLGIQFDEGVSFGREHGPYRQSKRRVLYKTYVQQLLDADKAYYVFDTPEELEAKRSELKNFQYDAHTRMQMRNSLTVMPEGCQQRIVDGGQYVARFLVKPGREIHVQDLIRNEVIAKSDILDDKVSYKSADELPTYHSANIVDDHLMEITHVIKGEEWLPSAPLHMLLYEAFDWTDTMPSFAYLPLLLKPGGKGKLSRCDGNRLDPPVFPLEWHDPKTGEVSSGFRESGYFLEAVVDFLTLLGRNPRTDQGIFSLNELADAFDIARCSKTGAKYDYQKGIQLDYEYMLQKSDDEIADLFVSIVADNGVDEPMDHIRQVVRMMKDRVDFVKELWPLCSFFFVAPLECDMKTVRKRWKPYSAEQMTELADLLKGLNDFSIGNQEQHVINWVKEKDYKLDDVMNVFRLTLVGVGKDPGMFDISAFPGKNETLRRLRKVIEEIPIVASHLA